MNTYDTKYFGQLSIDETSDYEYFDVTYNNEALYISLSGFNGHGDKLEECLEVINAYADVYETGKTSIAENYGENEVIRYYFKYHFDNLDKEILVQLFGVDDFKDFSIEKAAEKLLPPDLVFSIEEYGEIALSVDFRVSKEYSDEVLCIKMDEVLNIIDYTREN